MNLNLSNQRQSVPHFLSTTLPRVVLNVLSLTPLVLTALACSSCKKEKNRNAFSGNSPAKTPSTAGPRSANVRTGPSATPTTKKNAPVPQRDASSHAVANPHITHITCKATLKKLQPNYPWFENHGGSHSDGRAPLATFTVTQPKKHAGQTVSILFKYKKPPPPPTKKAVGKTFAFKIPQDFFTSKARILDNTCVRDLKQVKQVPK